MKLSFPCLFAIVASIFVGCHRSQEPEIGDWDLSNILVTAVITDTGYDDSGRDAFIVEADVRNLSAEPFDMYVMACSWNDSWKIEPSDVLELPSWSCDGNAPIRLTFHGRSGWRFRFLVCSSAAGAKIEKTRFRLGFACSRTYEEELLRRRVSHPPVARVLSDEMVVPWIEKKAVAIVDPAGERKEVPNQALQTTRTSRSEI